MTRPRTRSLNFSLIALSLSTAVEQAAAKEGGGPKIVIMHLDQPEAFRVVKANDPDLAAMINRNADQETKLKDIVMDGILRKDFVSPKLSSVRRSPAPMRRSKATEKSNRKTAQAKVAKPKPPPRKPPVRRKRKP